MKTLLIYISLSLGLYAMYYDSDIDGVDDSIDRCMNTPFDELVDEFGCSQNDNRGVWVVTVGLDNSYDTLDEISTTYNVAIDYSLKRWHFGLSSGHYINYDINGTSTRQTGDIYTYVGYEVPSDTLMTTFSLGMKIATANEDVGTGEYDYYASAQIEMLPSEKSKLFGSVLYTYTGDTATISYNNIFAYSIGMGYIINSSYYSSVYYENSQSIYDDSENYSALIWSNHYLFKKDYFVEFDYTRGLDAFSYDNMLSLRIGARF